MGEVIALRPRQACGCGPASLSEFVHASPQERERIGQGVVERAADQQAKIIADSAHRVK